MDLVVGDLEAVEDGVAVLGDLHHFAAEERVVEDVDIVDGFAGSEDFEFGVDVVFVADKVECGL